jgi:hypothetical protein
MLLDIANIFFMEVCYFLSKVKVPNITIIIIILKAMLLVALVILGCVFEERNDER